MDKHINYYIFIIFFILIGCKSEKKEVIFCDAEKINKNKNVFISNNFEFLGASSQSNQEAYEGEYSCKLDSINPNGLMITLNDLAPGEVFKISVYRKNNNNNGGINLKSLNGEIDLSSRISYGIKDENGWEKIDLVTQLPFNLEKLKGIKIWVYNNSKTTVYFDNLLIQREAYDKNKIDITKLPNSYNIEISDSNFNSLKQFRDLALEQNIILKNLKKEFPAILKYNGDTFNISIRFKGDWTDHLIGNKWSYRIKIKGDKALDGLKSFSIQAPEIRDFLHEWVAHEICKQEDLLTTDFRYKNITINGIDMGVYNIEEHFEKQLLESKQRREGPILKFSEDGFWERNIFMKRNGLDPLKPILNTASILPFKQKKTLKSEILNNEFLIGQNLMQLYKQGHPDIKKYLDVKRFAQYYALLDVLNVEHAITWHNQRLYYNPVTSKLEPIVFDCYSGLGEHNFRPIKIRGNDKEGILIINSSEEYLNKYIFNDPGFLDYYLEFLKKYSDEKFVDESLSKLNESIKSISKSFQKDYEGYSYDISFLKNNAKLIREHLNTYENKNKNRLINYTFEEIEINDCVTEKVFKNYSLNAHVENKNSDGSIILSLKNYHCKPIEIIGYKFKKSDDKISFLDNPISIKKYSNSSSPTEIIINKKPKKIYFKILESISDSIYSCKINNWKRPSAILKHQEALNFQVDKSSSIYYFNDSVITFNKGKHILTKPIIIPTGYSVIFNSGTELILNENLFFISYSPVIMKGTKTSPIKITSSDKLGEGFTIIQSRKESILDYVIFDGLSSLKNNGWSLTGAVVFAESDVSINNCTFTNNNCEDGLNIIQSNFTLTNSTISNTFSDGFDADFCVGSVSNSSFINTGNDGLDFSGSKISINNCTINNAGDKGISCGEKSSVEIDNVQIKTAIIGLASKDKSIVNIDKIELSDCNIGFQLFQKKPEYGPAFINIINLKISNVDVQNECQDGSEIIIEINP